MGWVGWALHERGFLCFFLCGYAGWDGWRWLHLAFHFAFLEDDFMVDEMSDGDELRIPFSDTCTCVALN